MSKKPSGATDSAEAPAPAPPEAAPEVAGAIEDIASTLAEERSDVQPHAIAEFQAQQAESQPQSGTDVKGTDANGVTFDANLHTGTKTSTGAWRAKKGAGKRSSAANTQSRLGAQPSPATPAAAGAVAKEQNARAGGKAAANLLIAMSVGIGGDEWHPRTNPGLGLDEKLMLEAVFGDYFVATGKQDLPPGWALVAGISMYALPRFAMPKTQARVGKIRGWFQARIVAWKARRAGLRVKVEPVKEPENA